MPVRLTFSGQNPANISNIRQQGFSPRLRLSIAPGQVFSSNNPAFSSSYGKGITLATPRGRVSIPSYNFAAGVPGSEIIQSPKQATAGMRSFDRMTERYSKTPTYDRLMKGQTVMGLGGKRFDPTELAKSYGSKALSFLSKASIPLSILSSTPLGADDEVTDDMRQSIDTTGINSIRGDYTRAPNTAFADLLSESAIADDDFEEMLAEATRKGQRESFLNQVADFLPFGSKSLTGNITRGIGSIFKNIAPASYGYSSRAFNALNPKGQAAARNIYGPGGIMSGYNMTSGFGRGPVGAIDNRINKIKNRRAAQTYASQKKIKDLYEARNKIAGTSMKGRTYTGFGKTGMGRDTSVQMSGKAPSRGRDRNVQMSGSTSSGGSSKIVCTMMNETYGFGNFRNKIWLRHSRDLPKEYEIGYHTIFLPLVKFAKGESKLNKVVKKTLEHVARHRTLDLKQEMKGKTHTLGRIYRKVLEPICFIVGKIKKWQK